MNEKEREYPKWAILQIKMWWPEFNLEQFDLHPRVLPTEGMMFKMNWKERYDPNGDDESGSETAEFLEQNGTNGWYKVHVWGIDYDWSESQGYIDNYTISLHTEADYNKKYGYLPLTQKICTN